MWRVIYDNKYHCYAIQKRKRFLFWTWWSSEYMCNEKEVAEKFIKFKLWQL